MGNISLKFILLVLIFNGIVEVYLALTETVVKKGFEIVLTSAGYVFVMILPLLLYFFRKHNVWIFLITFSLTLMTNKRGAIVIYLVLIIYYIFNYRIFLSKTKINIKTILLLLLLAVMYMVFYQETYSSLLNRYYLDEATGTIGSGRDVFWLYLFNYWLDSELINVLFGYGIVATKEIIGLVAHNDFLEYLFNYGIFGLFLWSFVLIKFFHNIKVVRKVDPYLYLMLMSCLIVLVGRGLFAGTLRTDNINLSISIGYLLAEFYKIKLSYCKYAN